VEGQTKKLGPQYVLDIICRFECGIGLSDGVRTANAC